MRAIQRISLLGDFLFAVPFLSRTGQGIGSRTGQGIGAIAVVLLLALLVFSVVSFGIGLRDRNKPPFAMGDRDA